MTHAVSVETIVDELETVQDRASIKRQPSAITGFLDSIRERYNS